MANKTIVVVILSLISFVLVLTFSIEINLAFNPRLLDNYVSSNPQILNSIVTNNPQLINNDGFGNVLESIIRKNPDLVISPADKKEIERLKKEIEGLKNNITSLENEIKALETKLEYANVIVTGNVAVSVPLPQGVVTREATGVLFRSHEDGWEVRASVISRIYKDLLRNDRTYSVIIEYRDNLENKRCIPKESPMKLTGNIREDRKDLECK